MADADTEVQEYQILNEPIGGKQPGETIELDPDVAGAFEDNLIPADEEVPEDAVRSQVIGGDQGRTTLADLNEPIEAGEYEVYSESIGDVAPGETGHFEADVARAFADNLLPTDGSGESGNSESESDADGDPDDTETDESNDGDGTVETLSFNTPEEFLGQTNQEIRAALAEADLSDEQLQKLLAAEQDGKDRDGAKEAIREHMGN